MFQNSGDFLCWKYKEVGCFYVSNLRQSSAIVYWEEYCRLCRADYCLKVEHKNTQPLYIFNKISVLHLEGLTLIYTGWPFYLLVKLFLRSCRIGLRRGLDYIVWFTHRNSSRIPILILHDFALCSRRAYLDQNWIYLHISIWMRVKTLLFYKLIAVLYIGIMDRLNQS